MRRPRAASSRARLSAAVPGTRGRAAPPPAVDGGATAPARARRWSLPRALASLRGPSLIVALVLAAIVVVGFVMRLVHIHYGLPYVYKYDEAHHFTNHSVNYFTGDFDPGHYQNPSGLTPPVYVVLRVQ